jgi:hypothetical protein
VSKLTVNDLGAFIKRITIRPCCDQQVGDFNSKEMKAIDCLVFKMEEIVKRKKVLLQNDCHLQRKQGITVNKEDARKPLSVRQGKQK